MPDFDLHDIQSCFLPTLAGSLTQLRVDPAPWILKSRGQDLVSKIDFREDNPALSGCMLTQDVPPDFDIRMGWGGGMRGLG